MFSVVQGAKKAEKAARKKKSDEARALAYDERAKMMAAEKAPSVLVEVDMPSEVPSDAPASKVHGE